MLHVRDLDLDRERDTYSSIQYILNLVLNLVLVIRD